ncbi:MAG: hypothetical protein ABFS28_12160 [Bacteroidota bacterium]
MQVILDIEKKVEAAAAGYRLSIENLLQQGLNLFRKEPAVFIIYSVIAVIVLSNPLSGILLGGPVVAGYYIVAHRINYNRSIELSDFFRSFDRFIPLLLVNLLISLLVSLGLMLLLIPGIYFAISCLFAHFFVWFYNVEPSEALRLSRKTVSGNFGQIFLLSLVLGGINVLGILAFGVGILLSLPFTYCVIYATFDDIIGIPN